MMVLVCHVILQDHMIKESLDFMGGSLSRQVTNLTSFGSHRHRGSGYIMLVVIEGQDFTCSCLGPPLLFTSKLLTHTMFQDIDTIICQWVQWRTSHLGHACLEEQLTELTYKTFATPSKNSARNKEKKKKRITIAKRFALHSYAKNTVKPVYSGHHRDLKTVSVYIKCPLRKGSFQIGLLSLRPYRE